MSRLIFIAALGCAAALLGPTISAGEAEISLDEVPDVVKQAAMDAVPGIELVSAEIEEQKGRTLYELEGTLDGQRYEIEITPEGKVIEVESGGDDEEEEPDVEDDEDTDDD